MSWRDDLRGVSRVDLACAALLVPIAIWAGSVAINDAAPASNSTQETQVQETSVGETYQETWDWCGGRFPYREDLQEACRWGAYEMIPGQDVPVTDEGIEHAADTHP